MWFSATKPTFFYIDKLRLNQRKTGFFNWQTDKHFVPYSSLDILT